MALLDRQRTITWPGPPAFRPRGRVLFLSCHLPWPPISGGRRRELELIKRLGAHFEIHLVVVSKTCDQDVANAGLLAGSCREVEVFPAQPTAETASDDQPLALTRHQSPAATERVAEILAQGTVDLVHVEGFYLLQHVPESPAVPVLLVEQNIEYDLEHQRASIRVDPGRRFELCARHLRTRAAELQSWRAVTRLATVTAEDRQMIEAELPGARVAVVPDGADHLPGNTESADHLTAIAERAAQIECLRPAAAPVIALLANFAYAPNCDAAQHLCRDILPALRAAVPDVHTWLVGNAPPPEVRALAGETVEVTGRVADVLPYLDAADVMVCPLRIGGGVKVKTIEALRRGKAIVSTPIGVQGLSPQARGALLVEKEAQAFAAAVASLLQDGDRRHELERRARSAAARLPTWDDSAGALAGVYDELLGCAPETEAQLVRIVAGRSG